MPSEYHTCHGLPAIGTAPHLGVSARVQSGNLVCGGNSHSVQSKQGVMPGRMTRAWPLKPSVPPSITGLIVELSGFPSSSYSVAGVTTSYQCRSMPQWAGTRGITT